MVQESLYEDHIGDGRIDNRTVFMGDCLDLLRRFDDDMADLIYLDPPFNSNRDYEAPVGTDADGCAFKDTWNENDLTAEVRIEAEQQMKWLHHLVAAADELGGRGMGAYLTYMAIRLFHMRRVLKPTGSIYLHCDPTASHFLRSVMDGVFGRGCFRNEIAWSFKKLNNSRANKFLRGHDTILFYAHKDAKFNSSTTGELTERQLQLIRAGYNTVTKNGKRHLLVYDMETYDRKVSEGKVNPSEYDEIKEINPSGPIISDVFEINWLNPGSSENLGYPTQKPIALLERIIKASSDPGDLVLDPFCGGGTTLLAAERLGRKWVGIDVGEKTFEFVGRRFAKEIGTPLLPEEQPVFRGMDQWPSESAEMKRPYNKDAVRAILGERQADPDNPGRAWCAYRDRGCTLGLSIPPYHLHIDHIVPQDAIIDNRISNLQLLCGRCNSVKGKKNNPGKDFWDN